MSSSLVLEAELSAQPFPNMRFLMPGIFLFFFLTTVVFVHAGEIDSVRAKVAPVQCFGLRNGVILIDTVFGGEKPFFYSLDGQTYTTNPIFDRLWAGDYMLHVRDASGATKSWPIKVKEPAFLDIKLLVSDLSVVAGGTVSIRALTSVEPEFLNQIEWWPAHLFPKQDTLRHTIPITETTQIAVIVHDQNGCMASDETTVEVEKANLYFPNVIKPGSATNAYFTVFAGEGVQQVVSLQVFSRTGSMVFERLDFLPNAPQLGWDGLWNGKSVESGVYPYLAVVALLDGKKIRYEGTVTVVN